MGGITDTFAAALLSLVHSWEPALQGRPASIVIDHLQLCKVLFCNGKMLAGEGGCICILQVMRL